MDNRKAHEQACKSSGVVALSNSTASQETTKRSEPKTETVRR